MQKYQSKYAPWRANSGIVLVLIMFLFAPLVALGLGENLSCARGWFQVKQDQATRGKVGYRCLDNSDQCPASPAKFYLTQTIVKEWDDNNPYYGCCDTPDPSTKQYRYNETDTCPTPSPTESGDGCSPGVTPSQTISGSYSESVDASGCPDDSSSSYSASYNASSNAWYDVDGLVGDPWEVNRYNMDYSGIKYLSSWDRTTFNCTSQIYTLTNPADGTGTSTITLSDPYETSDIETEASIISKARASVNDFKYGIPLISYHIEPDETCAKATYTSDWQIIITGAESGKSYDIRWTVSKEHANGSWERSTMQITATASGDPWTVAGPAITPPGWPSGNCYTNGTGTESISYSGVKVAPSAKQ